MNLLHSQLFRYGAAACIALKIAQREVPITYRCGCRSYCYVQYKPWPLSRTKALINWGKEPASRARHGGPNYFSHAKPTRAYTAEPSSFSSTGPLCSATHRLHRRRCSSNTPCDFREATAAFPWHPSRPHAACRRGWHGQSCLTMLSPFGVRDPALCALPHQSHRRRPRRCNDYASSMRSMHLH